MNQRQQIILSISIFLVVISGIFLPYEGELGLGELIFKKDMGYYFLFAPPTGREVREAISLASSHNPYLYSSHIITSRVLIQLVTIVVATLGLLLLFSGKRNKKSSNKAAPDPTTADLSKLPPGFWESMPFVNPSIILPPETLSPNKENQNDH